MNKMTPVEVLIKARQLIVEKGWGQFSYAKDVNGEACSFSEPTAHSFCAIGAINAVNCDPPGLAAKIILEDLYCNIHRSIPSWNDAPERTKEEVLEAFDKAIAYAQST